MILLDEVAVVGGVVTLTVVTGLVVEATSAVVSVEDDASS